MYLIWKLCITLRSLLKEGLYDRGFLSRSRFKAHTVVEYEMRIFVRVVLEVDVRSSSATMTDINASLSSF